MDKYKILAILLIIGIIAGIITIIVVSFSDRSFDKTSKVTIPTQEGGSMKVSDFYETAQVYERAVVLYADSNFTIQYDNLTQDFQITFSVLTLEDLKKYRFQAESELLKQLNIDQSQACRIKVMERAINNIEDSELPLEDFPMSFCAGGVIY